jgi:hypothetical protein
MLLFVKGMFDDQIQVLAGQVGFIGQQLGNCKVPGVSVP